MGWETRNGKGRYYTRSKREGGRVVREYLGSGPTAALIAQLDTLDRDKADYERWQVKAERKHAQDLEDALTTFCRGVEIVMRRVLEEAGYHRHARGPWRKRRETASKRRRRHGEE